ncbi:hypothetical protein EYZ11_011112 [Aspergillus tanneri]|uniref:Uncharacterized protein n=1 Tax=Aspergillus tanneri TaxID=1220188 RepID=A0A4S3J3L3_9EURO|nr:hypothetical protein EYZ11_011112 [Aspergillus tanneri]
MHLAYGTDLASQYGLRMTGGGLRLPRKVKQREKELNVLSFGLSL